MNIPILIFLGLSLVLLLIKIRSGMVVHVVHIKRFAMSVTSIVFILCLMLFSRTAVDAAVNGIKLWLFIVFPSLFPFFVASEILNRTGFVRVLEIVFEPLMRPVFNIPGCGAYALIMGITSGYPMGAKITTEMRKDGLLTKNEAERLLAFTNNSGPLFIVGAVSVGMFGMPDLGFTLLGCHILASITVGILFRFYNPGRNRANKTNSENRIKRIRAELTGEESKMNQNFSAIFGDAVRNSVHIMLSIGGFIIFFSVLINMLIKSGIIDWLSLKIMSVTCMPGISKDMVKSILSGFFEITTGTNMAAGVREVSIIQRMAAVSFIIGWAGLSVHSQVISIVKETYIGIKPYLIGKFLQGVFASFYCIVTLKLMGKEIPAADAAFKLDNIQNTPFYLYDPGLILGYAGISAAVLALCILLVFCCKRKWKRLADRQR